MSLKICISCEEEFDLSSPAKIKAGGKSTHCSECSVEIVVKYAGVQAADGKQAQATILKFDNEQDKNKYISFWQNNSGLYRGKSCQLGTHLSTTPKVTFTTVTGFSPTNHKGKSL